MNTVQLLGRTTAPIELKMTTTGKPVAQFTLAVKRPFAKDVTDFLNIVVWDKQAEIASKYVTKGSMIAIEGYITTRSWDTPDGKKASKTEIVAEKIHFTGKSDSASVNVNVPFESNSSPSVDNNASSSVNPDWFQEVSDAELPF